MPLADCSRGTHAEGEASNEGCAIQAVVHGMASCMATHKHIYMCHLLELLGEAHEPRQQSSQHLM